MYNYLLILKLFFHKGFYCFFVLVFCCTNSFGQIVNIENLRRNPNDTAKVKANLQSTFFYKNANQVIYSFNAKSFISYRRNNQMLLLNGDWGVTRAANQDYENQAFVHLRYNRCFNNWLVGEVFTQVQQNKILNVKYRYLFGIGPRYELVKRKNGNLAIGTLYMYEYEVPVGEYAKWEKNRLGSYLSFGVKINTNVSFSGTTYYQPNLAYFNDYRISGQYKILVSLTKKMSLKTESNIIYDSTPIAEAIKSYSDLMFGIQVDF